MIQVSDKYKENINADTELMECRAELSFVPPGADNGAEISSSQEADLSFKDQAANGDFNMAAKWGSLEPGRIVLDGSISFQSSQNPRQYGFWSKQICGADGVFAEKPVIEYTMTASYDIIGVSIAFDDLGGEYATELEIAYYDADNKLLHSKAFENDSVLFYGEQKQKGLKKIKITIGKWNVPKRMCKICQIVPGTILSFETEGIHGFESTEVITPFASSVTFPEYSLTIDNSDSDFNIVNPDGLVAYIRQQMVTVPKLCLISGERTDVVQMGKFYLYSWPQNDNADEVKITCRPSLAFVSDNYSLTEKTLQTVEQACEHIFADINEKINIDDELKEVQVNTFIGKEISKLDAMAQLAIACCGYWKFERNGDISLKNCIIPDVTNDVDYDKMWSKPSIEQGKTYATCTTKYYTVSSGKLVGTDVKIENGDVGENLNLPNSYFICSEAQAQQVAYKALAFENYRLTHKADYRGDPSIEAGDSVFIENDFKKSKVFVLKHLITFNSSGLTGSISGVGVDE